MASTGTHAGGVTPKIEAIPVGELEANCYLVLCPLTRQMAVIDPGAEAERIAGRITASGAQVAAILHTHGHFDHVGATEELLALLGGGIPVYAHPADAYLYEREARAMGATFGYAAPETLVQPERTLNDGDILAIGQVELEVISTPGHTPGSVSLLCGETCIFTGDTLFHRGIGRTDLPGGDEDAIYESIAARLYALPDALTAFPGHGPSTTIGAEKRENPFVRA